MSKFVNLDQVGRIIFNGKDHIRSKKFDQMTVLISAIKFWRTESDPVSDFYANPG